MLREQSSLKPTQQIVDAVTSEAKGLPGFGDVEQPHPLRRSALLDSREQSLDELVPIFRPHGRKYPPPAARPRHKATPT